MPSPNYTQTIVDDSFRSINAVMLLVGPPDVFLDWDALSVSEQTDVATLYAANKNVFPLASDAKMDVVRVTRNGKAVSFREAFAFKIKTRNTRPVSAISDLAQGLDPVGVNENNELIGPNGPIKQSEASPVYRFTNGAPELVHAPHPSRIVANGGTQLFAFNSAAPTMTNGAAALNTSYAWRERQTYALTANGAGNMSAVWNTALPAGSYDPANHYVLSIYNGGGTTSGLSISISGASGKSQSWTASGSGLRPGWNLLFLCSPTDNVAKGSTTSAGYGNQNGVMNVGASGGGGMANAAVTSISLSFFGAANGVTHYVDCIEVSTKVRPMVCWTWDQAYTDINPITSVANPFLNEVVPAFTAANLVGGVRYHHMIDSGTLGSANVTTAIAAGWEPFNGTLTRATPVTTAPDMFWQYALNHQRALQRGVKLSELGSPPGNNTSSDSIIGLDALPKMGISFCKGISHSAIVHGSHGYGNPQSLGVTSFDGKSSTEILALVDAAIACGTHVIAFSHYPKDAMTLSELTAALQGLSTRQAAGLIDVVGPATFVRGMRGEV